jgi:hypothetical protein
VTYQVDVRAFWDAHSNGDVRVSATIDDGRVRAFPPLTSAVIKAPDGSFVGESTLKRVRAEIIAIERAFPELRLPAGRRSSF